MQPKSFFSKANMSMLHHFSKRFTGSQSKQGYFSRQSLLPFVSLMVTCHHICHPVSLCTPHLALSVPVQMKKLFSVQNGNSRALVTNRSMFRCPLSGTVFLRAPPSHSSKLLLRPSSSLQPFPSYLDFLEDLLLLLFPHRLLTHVCC